MGRPDETGKIPQTPVSTQALKSLGDVEIGVVEGGHLVVMFFGAFLVAHALGNSSQPVMERMKFSTSSASITFRASR